MKKLKLGVVGAGAMGQSHVRIYSEMDNVDLVAVCDQDKSVIDKISGKYDVMVFKDYTEIDTPLDAVSICVPTKLHKKVALFFIEKGVHVLVEKPIASNSEESKELISSAKDNNVNLMVGHIERFNPIVTEVKKRIQNNELGRIYNITTLRFSPFPHRVIDVGVTVDLAVHDIDVMFYLNDSNLMRIYAETSQRIHANHEDMLNAVLKFDNDVTGVINTNWLTPRKVRELFVTGEKGMFIGKYLTQELIFYKNEFGEEDFDYSKGVFSVVEGEMIQIPINKKEPLKIELEEFINSIINKTRPAVNGEEGLKNLEIAYKILEASKKNEVVIL